MVTPNIEDENATDKRLILTTNFPKILKQFAQATAK